MVIGVHARVGISLAVPVVLVTGGHMIGGGIMGADVEMQGVGTGTAVSVDIIIGIYSTFGVLSFMPSVRIACILIVAVMGAVVNGQVKRDHTVTSGSVLLGIGGVACTSSIGYAMPSVLVACSLGLDARVAVVYCQVKGDHAVTSGSVLLSIGGVACTGRVSYSMPSVLVACGMSFCCSITVVDSEVKMMDGVP